MARFASGLVLALALASCSQNPAPQPAPGPLSTPAVGLNDGFHGPLPPEIANHYTGYRHQFVIRTPQLSGAALQAFYASIRDLSLYNRSFIGGWLKILALVEGPDAALAADVAAQQPDIIENGNELELPPHELSPQMYAVVQVQMHDAERAAGFTGEIIMGSVYALTDATKQAITLALGRCATSRIQSALVGVGANVDRVSDCLIGVHLYTITRADIDWLNAQDADVALTETGSPTNCDPAKLPAQAAYQQALYAAAVQIRRLRYFLVYQGGDGPSCSNLDTFGIRSHPAESFF
jgi:hypothetical protein